MKKKILTILTISAFGALMTGCRTEMTFSTNNANAAKPIAAANASNTAANSSSTKTEAKPKAKLTGEKKPEGESKKVKNNSVPANWIYIYDEARGYGFSVPEGTTGEMEAVPGVDVMAVTTPAPSEIDIFVLAYKNEELTKEDLLNDAVKFLEELGQKVTPGQLRAESEDYAVADAAVVHPERGKGKLRILVGTDVTDNYVMILGTEETRFAANEKIIDEIWGSFEMWSGGASGNN